MDQQQTFDTFTEMLHEAEDTLRKGNATLSEWGAQARDILENKPGVLLGAVAISGFVVGSLIRGGIQGRGRLREIFPVDPLLTFAAGTAAGLLLGSRIFDQLIALREPMHETHEPGGPRPGLTTSESLHEKPFEKSFPDGIPGSEG